MTPSHAAKHAKRYRYYITTNIVSGGPTAWRVPAHDLEQLVIARLCRHLVEPPANSDLSLDSEDNESRRIAHNRWPMLQNECRPS